MEAPPSTSQLLIIKKIFANIINNPNEAKYRKIYLIRLNKKFGHTSAYLKWLCNAGFVKCHDSQHKLILNGNDLNILQSLQSKLTALLNIHHNIDTTSSVMILNLFIFFVT